MVDCVDEGWFVGFVAGFRVVMVVELDVWKGKKVGEDKGEAVGRCKVEKVHCCRSINHEHCAIERGLSCSPHYAAV